MTNSSDFSLTNDLLRIRASIVPWDSATFGFQVAQISVLEVSDDVVKTAGLASFFEWTGQHDIRHVSCRLSSDKMREARFLEEHGFHFMEMVIHPYIIDIQDRRIPSPLVQVEVAVDRDVDSIVRIAESAFGHERYHIDPNVPMSLADRRYGNWVRNTFANKGSQTVLKLVLDSAIVGFFIVEFASVGTCYWHLTALDPAAQGGGLGTAAWQSVMHHLQQLGCHSISTTIAIRNVRVMNLYSKLGFRYRDPAMTFHWWR